MGDVRIVIVDDSSFSIAFIRDILEGNGFKVVGEAGSLEEVKEVIREKNKAYHLIELTFEEFKRHCLIYTMTIGKSI